MSTVAHLFAGSGGCTLGFARAGFRSLGSFDFDAKACRDLERLTGGPAFVRNLAALQPGTKRPCYLVIRAPDGTWHRPLTDRELAVLQGFPVDCCLEGPSSSSRAGGAGRREHIGNAIPPPTAEAIAREVAATLRSTSVAGEGAEVGKFLREQQEQAAPIVDAKLAPLMKAWANLNTGRDLGGILGA